MKQISLNFGAIRDSVVRHASKELISENGNTTTILESFLKSLKDDSVLKLQYLVFKNLEDGTFSKERLAERYISQNMKILEGVSWEKILESNRTLRVALLENSHVEGEKDKRALYEHIHVLIEANIRKSFVNIDMSEQSYEAVLAHLTREQEESKVIKEENDNPKLLSWKYVTKLAVNNFNQRYAHLNENEMSLLKTLLSTEDTKKNVLEDLIKENSELIDSILNEGVEDKSVESSLNMFKDKIESLSNNDNGNLDESIINCTELKEELLEMRK